MRLLLVRQAPKYASELTATQRLVKYFNRVQFPCKVIKSLFSTKSKVHIDFDFKLKNFFLTILTGKNYKDNSIQEFEI